MQQEATVTKRSSVEELFTLGALKGTKPTLLERLLLPLMPLSVAMMEGLIRRRAKQAGLPDAQIQRIIDSGKTADLERVHRNLLGGE